MKKNILLLFFIVVALSACGVNSYKRISLNKQTLGDGALSYIDHKTKVVDSVEKEFPAKMPLYRISERKISKSEYKKMLEELNIIENGRTGTYDQNVEGNSLSLSLGYVEMDKYTVDNDVLEQKAWEVFHKIPFLEGEYQYVGVVGKYTLSTYQETYVTRVTVRFTRQLSGVSVTGNDKCDFDFSINGLVGIHIRTYHYKELESVDLLRLESAKKRILNPDGFLIDDAYNEEKQETCILLEVSKIRLRYENQFLGGCSVLQPVYDFQGIATDAKGNTAPFTSSIIALP